MTSEYIKPKDAAEMTGLTVANSGFSLDALLQKYEQESVAVTIIQNLPADQEEGTSAGVDCSKLIFGGESKEEIIKDDLYAAIKDSEVSSFSVSIPSDEDEDDASPELVILLTSQRIDGQKAADIQNNKENWWEV